MKQLVCTCLPGFPMVEPGDDLAAQIVRALADGGCVPRDGDVLVLAQKIVSKAQGRYVVLADVVPGPEALALAKTVGRDPRLVEVVLSESRRVVRAAPGLLVVEHRLGFIMANAGIDQSNITHGKDGAGERVLLLPHDPDGTAQTLRDALAQATGVPMGIIINDSWGRPWRRGVTGVAIGAAGIPSFLDMRGTPDIYGRAMQSTELALGDELAALGSLMMGQGAEGSPVVHIRGFTHPGPASPASALLRPAEQDRFR